MFLGLDLSNFSAYVYSQILRIVQCNHNHSDFFHPPLLLLCLNGCFVNTKYMIACRRNTAVKTISSLISNDQIFKKVTQPIVPIFTNV